MRFEALDSNEVYYSSGYREVYFDALSVGVLRIAAGQLRHSNSSNMLDQAPKLSNKVSQHRAKIANADKFPSLFVARKGVDSRSELCF